MTARDTIRQALARRSGTWRLVAFRPFSQMQLTKHREKSKMIAGYAFIGEARGSLRIQFKDKNGELTSLGDYLDVPRSLFNQFQLATLPDQFFSQHVKPHFEWSLLSNSAGPEDTNTGCGCMGGTDGGRW